MQKKHQKHANLTKPNFGNFGRNEWAIIGTPCGKIQKLAFTLIEQLSKEYKVSYVDADHQSGDAEQDEGRNPKSAMAYGASLEYTDKITFHRFDQEAKLDTYQYRQLFNEQDLVLVNGNHFKAKNQIVVIDPKKAKSLERKLDRLTNVQLILLNGEGLSIYPFLKNHLNEIEKIPVLLLDDIEAIAEFLHTKMREAIPPIYGLVLAGGKSQRMGEDKGLIDYHGKPQREYMADLLDSLCDKTFLSCRPDQVDLLDSNYSALPDQFLGLGPFGAIASAFLQHPNRAWLVVACDLPLLNQSTLQQLIDHRDPSKIATAFNSPVNEFPEPLIAIWEPKSYLVLLQFLTQGYSCPRKVLINSDVQLIDAAKPEALSNVNKPEELDEIKKLIGASAN